MIKPFMRIFASMLLLCSCSSFELHIKEGASIPPPSLILIQNFDVRDSDFDPHIADEFSEALRFEFFKMGYMSRIIDNSEKRGSVDDPEFVEGLCSKFKGSILIAGVISRRETGFLTERKESSGITFQVYSGRGVLLSEGCFNDPDSPDIYAAGRMAAQKFTGELSSQLWGR